MRRQGTDVKKEVTEVSNFEWMSLGAMEQRVTWRVSQKELGGFEIERPEGWLGFSLLFHIGAAG